MAVQKARIVRQVVLGTAALFVVWLFGVWPPPVWWRDHEPRCTAMMRLRGAPSGCRRPAVPLSAIAPRLVRMLIIAEDSRFRTHHGIDLVELREAWRERARRGELRGASTITQQLAKNLYLSPSRSPLRKLKEAVTALRLELALPKDRIIELYLNVAEWGPGVWGVSAASAAYFGVPPSQLTDAQAAALAATLPQPRTSNPAYRPGRMLARRDLILARYYGGSIPVPHAGEDSIPFIPPITAPLLPPVIETLMDSLRVRPDSGKDSLVHQP
ncbi:MAG TPA: biosynthetic peptidoglycan transglycosylase [Gemmatimonadales bacterium]|nr:biosynthetic peptidoglycan transglycosylase [Gemmatimonadales bacterium]